MAEFEITPNEAWKNAFAAEFTRYAVRWGWATDDASVWAGEIKGEALLRGGTDPEAQARLDVIECEKEAASYP